MRLDNRVWITLIALAVVFEGFYLYKVFNPAKRIPFTFTVKRSGSDIDTSVFKQKDYIYFEAVPANQNIIWDFGDHKEQLQGTPVAHQFDSVGKFEVKVKLGGLEYDAREVTVTPLEVPKPRIYRIIADGSAEVNKPVTFYCPDSAGSYEWSVKDYPNLGSGTGAQQIFTFPIENKSYTVECKLDKDKAKTATWEIYIVAKPVEVSKGPKNVKTKSELCNQPMEGPKFAAMLKDVLYSGTIPPGNFSQYLCNEDQTAVTVNKHQMTFGQFISLLGRIDDKDKYDKRRDGAQRIGIEVTMEREDGMFGGEHVKLAVKTLKIYMGQETSGTGGRNLGHRDLDLGKYLK